MTKEKSLQKNNTFVRERTTNHHIGVSGNDKSQQTANKKGKKTE